MDAHRRGTVALRGEQSIAQSFDFKTPTAYRCRPWSIRVTPRLCYATVARLCNTSAAQCVSYMRLLLNKSEKIRRIVCAVHLPKATTHKAQQSACAVIEPQPGARF